MSEPNFVVGGRTFGTVVVGVELGEFASAFEYRAQHPIGR